MNINISNYKLLILIILNKFLIKLLIKIKLLMIYLLILLFKLLINKYLM